MTFSQRTHAQIAPIALLVVVLAAADWVLAPGHALNWIIGVGTMAAVWLTVILIERSSATQTESERRYLALSAVIAGVMLAMALGVTLLEAVGFENAAVLARAKGVLGGVLLMVMGNASPKVLGPLAAKRCSPASTLSIQRFSGWTFMIAGLIYAGVWIFAPASQADVISTLACAGALTLVVARCAWAFVSPPGRKPSA